MRFRRFSMLAVAPLAALVLSACVDVGERLVARDIIEETRALQPDGRFELENVNGRITLRTWAQNEVLIEAERAATSERVRDDIEIAIEGEGGEVRVRTRHPNRRNWLLGGQRGKVDYEITVPRGVDVRLKTVNGPVDVEGLTGNLRVQSVNGGLELADLEGQVQASTVNGGIHAGFDRVPEGGQHRFKTVNGGIEVSLPAGTGGRLEAGTVNGSIHCDLPLDVTRKRKKRLEGSLGPGSGRFELSTVNGGINVVTGMDRRPAEAATESARAKS